MINQSGIDLIREFEGEKLEPYQDVAGLWTIGIGHLIRSGEHFTGITREQSEDLLRSDLKLACQGVTDCVKVPVNPNQYSALVSFAYNCGVGALRTSTLLKKLNSGDIDGAEGEFLKWNKAGGKVVAGLTRRREAEALLFSTPA